MANYSTDPTLFNVELLDALKQALLDIALGGGVKRVKKGDFDATYRSPAEIEKAIAKVEREILIQKHTVCYFMGGLRCR